MVIIDNDKTDKFVTEKNCVGPKKKNNELVIACHGFGRYFKWNWQILRSSIENLCTVRWQNVNDAMVMVLNFLRMSLPREMDYVLALLYQLPFKHMD